MSERKTPPRGGVETKDADADDEARGRLLSRIEKRWASAEAQHAGAYIPEAERKKTERARLLAQRLGRPVRATPIEQLVAENPGDLADDVARLVRDLATLDDEKARAIEATKRDRDAAARLRSELRFDGTSSEYRVARSALQRVQVEIADLVRDELDYLGYLGRHDDEAALEIAETHLDAGYGRERAEIRTRLERLIDERTPFERELVREREASERRRVALEREISDAERREKASIAQQATAVRLAARLESLKNDLVEKLEYEATGEALLEDAVDEQAIEVRCKDEKTSAEYRASAVCKAAREWADDVKCTVRDTGRPTSVLTHDEVEPADRIRLRFKKITGASGAGTTATVTRCFDLGSLKYLIAVSRADGVAPVEPETKLPLSKAQLRRIDALPWPKSDSRVEETIDELLALFESKTRSLETVQRRQELVTRLVWLRYGSPGLLVDQFPGLSDDDTAKFAYSDDEYWWEMAEDGTPESLRHPRPPPISDSTRRQSVYYEEEEAQ